MQMGLVSPLDRYEIKGSVHILTGSLLHHCPHMPFCTPDNMGCDEMAHPLPLPPP